MALRAFLKVYRTMAELHGWGEGKVIISWEDMAWGKERKWY
jgi:hypothetical protein